MVEETLIPLWTVEKGYTEKNSDYNTTPLEGLAMEMVMAGEKIAVATVPMEDMSLSYVVTYTPEASGSAVKKATYPLPLDRPEQAEDTLLKILKDNYRVLATPQTAEKLRQIGPFEIGGKTYRFG